MPNDFVETTCRHYRGISGCLARDLELFKQENGITRGAYLHLPCCMSAALQKQRKERGIVPLTCEFHELLTPEEAAAEREEVAKLTERMQKLGPVLEGIRKEYKGRSGTGTVVCPSCGGVLRFSISASNGHIHGCCDTENCFRFME